MMLFKLLATTVVLLASIPRGLTQSLNEPCTNPHGQPGRCVFLRECQPLLDIYRRDNVSYGESEFFYGSRCSGQFEGKPLVSSISRRVMQVLEKVFFLASCAASRHRQTPPPACREPRPTVDWPRRNGSSVATKLPSVSSPGWHC